MLTSEQYLTYGLLTGSDESSRRNLLEEKSAPAPGRRGFV